MINLLIEEKIITKYCSRCGQTKSIDEFHKNISAKDGLQSSCRECCKIYQQSQKKTDRIHRKKEKVEFLPKVKKCSKCKQILLQSKFSLSPSRPDGLHSQCVKCARKIRKEYRKNNDLELKYGITEAQYDLILESQNSVCKICGKTPEENGRALAVDHNHKTGKIRGLLCNNCNRAIGYFNDDSKLMRISADYIDKNKG